MRNARRHSRRKAAGPDLNLLYAAVRLHGFEVDALKLQPGDWISVRQRGGLYHQGIVVGDGHVVHAAKKLGKVVKTSLASFAHGREVRLVHRHENPLEQWRAELHALNSVGKSYNLLFANCEHFASEASLGQRESQQVDVLKRVARYAVDRALLGRSQTA